MINKESIFRKNIKVPEWEMEFRADRSSGPGGQGVNKTASKVTVRFEVGASKTLSAEQKVMVRREMAGFLNKEDEIVMSEQNSRSQWQNRQNVIRRLNEKINEAIIPEKERKAMEISKSAKIQILEAKKAHGQKKKMRSEKIEW